MGLSVEVGTKLSPGATGVQNYALSGANWGSGITPKALIVWTTNQAADGVIATYGCFAFGCATARGGNKQSFYCSYLLDPSNTASRIVSGNDWFDQVANPTLLTVYNTPNSGVADWAISFAGFASDQWSIDWTDLPAVASTFLHYIVLGGSDITDAFANGGADIQAGDTTPKNVQVKAGFGLPDLVMMLCPGTPDILGNLVEHLQPSIGWGYDDTNQAAVLMKDDDAAGTMLTRSWAKDGRIGLGIATGADTADFEVSLQARASWPADSFSLAVNDAPSATRRMMFLALKGSFKKTIGKSAGTLTAAGNQDLAAGFPPKLGFVWGHVMPSAQTIQEATANADATALNVGATDGTTQWSMGIAQDDGKTTSFGRSFVDRTQTLYAAEAVAVATRAKAVGSFTGNNFRLAYGTVNATARQFHWLALGDGVPATSLLPDVRRVLRNMLLRR